MDEQATVYTEEHVKLPFSRVGWTLFAILGITTALQIAGGAVVYLLAPQLNKTSWFSWVLTFAPLYFIAIPVGYIIIKPIPKIVVPQQRLGFGKLIVFFAMSYAVMYIGNIVGTLLNAGISALRGTELTNPLLALMTGSNIYIELFVVGVCAPVMEELVFRKMLIDRIRVYGEGTAILVSGLTFGLFHGNLFQFFYAFGLGALFAYVYLRTGRVRYTIILHAMINSFSVILSQFLLNSGSGALESMSGDNPEELLNLIQGNLSQYIGIAICLFIALALFISGLVLLITKRKQAVLFTAPKELPKAGRFKTVFLNWGMVLYILLALGLMVYMAVGV